MNKNRAKIMTENELIMVVNCLNILYGKYVKAPLSKGKEEYKKITENHMIDNIFVTNGQLIKLSLPEVIYPLR